MMVGGTTGSAGADANAGVWRGSAGIGGSVGVGGEGIYLVNIDVDDGYVVMIAVFVQGLLGCAYKESYPRNRRLRSEIATILDIRRKWNETVRWKWRDHL